jgi:hypothetical protein
LADRNGSALLMGNELVTYVLQYGVYAAEAALFILLLRRGRWKRLVGLFLYVTFLFAVDGLARPQFLYYFGGGSRLFAYFYWLTDVLLALGAFLLIGAFFRRACAQEEKMWGYVRLLLVSIFTLVLAVSALSLSRNYKHLFTLFIFEFSQNLYFTCLVLNTLLYILIQQTQNVDNELGLLVCGIGIQFAGEGACLALYHLTGGDHFARSITPFIAAACTLGMLAVWFYAVAKLPQAATAPARAEMAPDMTAVAADVEA